MIVEVLVGAVLSLVILAGLVALVLKRAPGALVADKFPERFYDRSGGGGERVTDADGVDVDGVDVSDDRDSG